MTTALTLADPTETWDGQPEAGFALRERRDRRKKSGCEICGRAIHGYGRICWGGPVNQAAPWGCSHWLREFALSKGALLEP